MEQRIHDANVGEVKIADDDRIEGHIKEKVVNL